jgi:hypothetical protein
MPVAGRRARIDLIADPNKLDPGLRQARSKLGNFGNAVKKVVKLVAGGAGAVVGAGVGLATSQVDDVIEYERSIARLAIAQGKSNDQMRDFQLEVTKASDDWGVARNEVMKGVLAYQALTGDTAGATAAARTLAKVAQGTGAAVADVAGAAASLRDNLGIDPSKFEEMFSILNVQGKAGSVELKDFAQEVAALSAQWKQFRGGTGVAGATELGAAFQTVRKDVGSSSEAATRLLALSTSLVRNSSKLKSAGIRVFDVKNGREVRRSFSAIMDDFRRAKLGDTKLQKILGSSEAVQALNAIKGHWQDFKGLVATTDTGSIDRDVKQYLASTAGKLEKSWNAVKLAVADAFTPERLEKFAVMLERLAGTVDWMANRVNDVEDGISALTGDTQHLISPEQEGSWRSQIGVGAPKGARRNIGSIFDSIRGDDSDLAAGARAAAAYTNAELANAASREIIRELKHIGTMLGPRSQPTVVKVDGNEVAKASAAAADARRRPGG